MPRFDIPGRDGPATVMAHDRNGRERRFPLPYSTEDPRDIKALTDAGAVALADPKPTAIPADHKMPPAPVQTPKPTKGGEAK